MRCQKIIDFRQHFTNAQISSFRDCGGKIAPEPGKHVFVIAIPGRYIIKLRLQIGGEIIFHIFAEIVGQESSDEATFIHWDKAVLVTPHIFAVHNRGHNRRIG